ncbi:TPA: type III secretion system needle tip protein SctA [Serratia liquefaciens]|nr:type III secretion system needle tip protein SctA [Serratia liquefaciens]
MSSVQNMANFPFSAVKSPPEPQEKPSSEKVEPPVSAEKGISGPEMQGFNNAGAKAEALRQVLQQNGRATPPDEASRDERELASRQFSNSLRALAKHPGMLKAEQKNAVRDEINRASDKPLLKGESKVDKPLLQNKSKVIEDKAIWEQASAAIDQIGNEYLGVYEDAVSKYTDFYKAYSNVNAQMGTWINSSTDGKKIKFDIGKLNDALKKLTSDFSSPNKSAVLFPSQSSNNIKGATQSEAQKWAKEMGLPDSCVEKSGDGSYIVVIDLTPLKNMQRDLGNLGSGNVELDNAKFQAWQTGFNAQAEGMKNTMQTLTQKYSNANSLYDNLVKVLSSTISSCLETAKTFLRG